MKETSGATLRVIKTGSDDKVETRLRAQYDWLVRRRGDPAQVTVGAWLGCGYDMEYLHRREWWANPADMWRGTFLALRALSTGIWREPAVVPRWEPGTYVYWFDPGLGVWLKDLEITPEMYCLTHGDATLENLLVRPARDRTYQVVFIDPLPDTVTDRKVPSVRALDMGKLLQSGLGYERVKHGIENRWRVNDAIFEAVKGVARSKAEWQLACWCCALHVQRFIPYQTPELGVRWKLWWPDILATLRLISTGF